MKLISLNTWGGRGGMDGLLAFFKEHQDVDVFCLQEVWNGGERMIGKIAGGVPLAGISTQLFSQIEKTLPDHQPFFAPHFFDFYGLTMFVRSDIEVLEHGDLFVYKEQGWISEKDNGNHARNIQYLTIATPKGKCTIINFHGIWNGKGKSDSDDRLLQSDNILAFLNGLDNPFVLIGDFNLRPDTESIRKFEEAGLRNLISEYDITSTRTSLYTKPEKFADYAFISGDIDLRDFKVLPDGVSDHAPLYLEFD